MPPTACSQPSRTLRTQSGPATAAIHAPDCSHAMRSARAIPAARDPGSRIDRSATGCSPRSLPCCRHFLPQSLALADGTVFRGHSIGASGSHDRRSGVQHRDHRLSGNPDRPELRPPDRDPDVSAYRQRRRECRRRRSHQSPCRRPDHSRPAGARFQLPLGAVALAEYLQGARRRRHRGHRHAQAHAHPARQGRAERLHPRRSDRRSEGARTRALVPGSRGHGPREGRVDEGNLRLDADRMASGVAATASRRRRSIASSRSTTA